MPTIADYVASIRIDARGAERSLNQFDRQAQKTAGQVENRFSDLGGSIGGSLKGGFAVATAGLSVGGFVKVAADIEAGFIGVQKTTGLTNDELATLKNNLLDFSTQAPVAVDSLIDITKVAGQLGIQGAANIEKFTRTFAMLEVASDRSVSGEFGAQEFAKFVEASGAGIENAERVASAMTLLGNTSKLTEGQLLSVASEVGKVSKSFGISASAALGISAAFQELSITPEVARTTILSFFSAVEKATETGKGMDALAKATGLTAQRIKELKDSNPEQILAAFASSLDNLDVESRNKALKELNLTGVTMGATFKVLTSNQELLTKKINDGNKAYEQNTALLAEFDSANRGVNAEITKLKNSFTSLVDATANSGFLDWLASVINTFGGVIESIGEVVRNFDIFKKAFSESGSIFDSARELGAKLFGKDGSRADLGVRVLGEREDEPEAAQRPATTSRSVGSAREGFTRQVEIETQSTEVDSDTPPKEDNFFIKGLKAAFGGGSQDKPESSTERIESATTTNNNQTTIEKPVINTDRTETVSNNTELRTERVVEQSAEPKPPIIIERPTVKTERVENNSNNTELRTERVIVNQGQAPAPVNNSERIETNNNQTTVEKPVINTERIENTTNNTEIRSERTTTVASPKRETAIPDKIAQPSKEPFIPKQQEPETGVIEKLANLIGIKTAQAAEPAPAAPRTQGQMIREKIDQVIMNQQQMEMPQPISNFSTTNNNTRNQDIRVSNNFNITGAPDQRAVQQVAEGAERGTRRGFTGPELPLDLAGTR